MGLNLLFKNSLRGTSLKKVQIYGLILLVMLSTAIYTVLETTNNIMEKTVNNYLETQNVMHFTFIPSQINFKPTDSEFDEMVRDYRIDRMDFKKSQYNFSTISNEYGIDIYPYILRYMDEVATTLAIEYDFYFERRLSKTIIYRHNDINHKVKLLTASNEINKTYLIEGRLPENINEVTITDIYAKNNNLNIGDAFSISNKKFIVVGYAYQPDYIIPLISYDSPIPDPKTQTVVTIHPEAFELFDEKLEITYGARFNDEIYNVEKIKQIKDSQIIKMLNSREEGYNSIRINSIYKRIESTKLLSKSFMGFLLFITMLMIIVIIHKRVNNDKVSIGVLKSLGYKNREIAKAYLVYSIIAGLLGGLIGYLIGILLHPKLLKINERFFNIKFIEHDFNIRILFNTVVVPFFILFISSYIIAITIVKRKPIHLVNNISSVRLNIFERLFSKMVKPLNFKTRIKYLLAFRSLGKLLIIFISVFISSQFMIFLLIGSSMFDDMVDKSFMGHKFRNEITYEGVVNKDEVTIYDDEEEYISYIIDVSEIKYQDGLEKKIDSDEEQIQTIIYGLNPDSKMVRLHNKNENDITSKLDQGVIINSLFESNHNVSLGDVVVVQRTNGEKIDLEVVGVVDNYNGQLIYTNLNETRDIFDLKEGQYNGKWTNRDYQLHDENVFSIFRLEDLKRNLEELVALSKISINLIVVFSGIFSLIIIAVVSNISIEDNRKNISLLKVLGYNNKEISKIILNIYTPTIFLGYILAIPITIKILREIIKYVSKETDILVPIYLSASKGLFGFVVILVIYYISRLLSKRSINSISLQESLKRE